jgi:LSD1 subclass zinc finger protein
MPINFPCPHCRKPLFTPDGMEGRQVRCPGCQAIATVPAPSAVAAAPAAMPMPKPAPPPPQQPPAPMPPAAMPHRNVAAAPPVAPIQAPAPPPSPSAPPVAAPFEEVPVSLEPDNRIPFLGLATSDLTGLWQFRPADGSPWTTVQNGLTLMGLATLIQACAAVTDLFSSIFVVLDASALVLLFALLYWAMELASFALHAVGLFMCCATPKETGLYGLILAAAICWVSILGAIAAPFVFLVYVRALAQRYGNETLARSALSLLIAIAVALSLLCLVIAALSGVLFEGDRDAAKLRMFLTLVVTVGAVILYANFLRLLIDVRTLIANAGARA